MVQFFEFGYADLLARTEGPSEYLETFSALGEVAGAEGDWETSQRFVQAVKDLQEGKMASVQFASLVQGMPGEILSSWTARIQIRASLKTLFLPVSFPRKRESKGLNWIPAYAGMTNTGFLEVPIREKEALCERLYKAVQHFFESKIAASLGATFVAHYPYAAEPLTWGLPPPFFPVSEAPGVERASQVVAVRKHPHSAWSWGTYEAMAKAKNAKVMMVRQGPYGSK